jgi:hypothetical protein
LTFYGDAFRVFAELNPSLDLNAAVPLATLGVLCCVALDGTFPAERGARVSGWQDVHPAVRFVALSQVLGTVGLLPAHSVCAMDSAAYREYVNRLCDAAGIAPPSPYLAPHPPGGWANSPTNDLRHLHHDAASAAATLMHELPAAIVAPAEASVYLEERLLAEEMRPLQLATHAPLLILGEIASSIGLDGERFWRCAIGGVYQRFMIGLFAGHGPLRPRGRPACGRGRMMAEEAVRLAERRLGVEIQYRDGPTS